MWLWAFVPPYGTPLQHESSIETLKSSMAVGLDGREERHSGFLLFAGESEKMLSRARRLSTKMRA
jgi:hypothetical protein